ncbi:NADP-dependent oxidoreductase [Streptomyces paludis]|uniref:NADP-dependent oxidoreductase n=1 Tax=Streptomyces paludis TaxID=2282738 RepID=A0A345HZS6_9ACTN|nr:NADP-dependent oxidoreductase [Streptomyces paludis]AXG82200.1 NADP-dependent oxidoreductase [Streptomyces paludis]
MKAVTVTEFGTPPELREVPEPTVGPGRILVRVEASSVNWLDAGIAQGVFQDVAPHESPVTLGRDFAGVVEAVGPGVTGVKAGVRVFGEVPLGVPIGNGAWAERIVIGTDAFVPTPAGVDTVTAGAAGLAAVTAVMTFDALDLRPGQTLAVVGATGGVGGMVAQLARAAGAVVVAPGLSEDETYLHGLGVTAVLPRGGDVVAVVRERYPEGVDALVDAVTSYRPTPYASAVGDGGRIASPTGAAGEGRGRTNIVHAPTAGILRRVALYLEDGTITVTVGRTFALSEAPEALRALTGGHTRGKIALRVA